MPSLVSTMPPYSLALEGTGPLSATLVFLLPLTTTEADDTYDDEGPRRVRRTGASGGLPGWGSSWPAGPQSGGLFRGRRSTCLLLWLGIWVAVRPLLLAYSYVEYAPIRAEVQSASARLSSAPLDLAGRSKAQLPCYVIATERYVEHPIVMDRFCLFSSVDVHRGYPSSLPNGCLSAS